MINDNYILKVSPGTRNHKGCFIQDTTYKLIAIDQAGWALICLDEMSCHYVDPDDLCEMPVDSIAEVLS
jgi:hypothetical protein